MSDTPEVIVAESADALASDVAARAYDVLGAALQARGSAHLVVTGGGILEQVLEALANVPAGFDWSQVQVWWGDERYVPSDSSDRNELPARRLLFDRVPAQVHPMPASDAGFSSPEDAADAYAAQLAAAAGGSDVPAFDLILLGVGPDAHCASLFPEHPATLVQDRSVIAVHNSPKPPPTRVSLTFPALDAAAEVWFVVSGGGKADAVAKALSGLPREQVPSAGPRGTSRTLWLVDRDAAASLPS